MVTKKEWFLNYGHDSGWDALTEIQQKLEFTKFQCIDDKFDLESCTKLAAFEGNIYSDNLC